MIIAIDGPAGSGKSSVSKLVAKKLGLLYVDTGAMYRAITLKAVRCGADMHNKKALVKVASEAGIELKPDKDNNLKIFLDGEDATKAIRTPELTKNIKHVAGIPGVRKEMVVIQRRVARESAKGAVLEGRDIGTVVFPDADYKFYLDADFRVRVSRRHKELVEADQSVTISEVEQDAAQRDKSDMTRQVAPLKKAEDANLIDTTNMSIDEAVARIIDEVKR